MSKGAKYVKVKVSESERAKSLVGYRVIADIVTDGVARGLLLERPDAVVAPDPKPKAKRKRRTKAELAAAKEQVNMTVEA